MRTFALLQSAGNTKKEFNRINIANFTNTYFTHTIYYVVVVHTENVRSLAIQITDAFKIFKFSSISSANIVWEMSLWKLTHLGLVLSDTQTVSSLTIKRYMNKQLPSRLYTQNTHQHAHATMPKHQPYKMYIQITLRQYTKNKTHVFFDFLYTLSTVLYRFSCALGIKSK